MNQLTEYIFCRPSALASTEAITEFVKYHLRGTQQCARAFAHAGGGGGGGSRRNHEGAKVEGIGCHCKVSFHFKGTFSCRKGLTSLESYAPGLRLLNNA